MTRFVVRRLVGVAASLYLALTFVFLTIHLIPGDPAQAALAQSTASLDVLERRREALGLDQPLSVQYLRFVSKLLRGDLGLSWSAGQPVSLLIAQQLAATLSLATASMGVAVGVGGCIGVIAAGHLDQPPARLARVLASLLTSIPVMFSGTFLIWVFAVGLRWFPATGGGDLAHLMLPAIALGLAVAGSIARAVDGGVTEIMHQAFMQTALAKGLSRRRAFLRHALRVGLLPTLDVVALQFGYLLGGTVIVESVFARQGIGRLLLSAVLDKDLPVLQGVVILAALTYGLLNVVADLAHAAFDPRIRLDA